MLKNVKIVAQISQWDIIHTSQHSAIKKPINH